jgi:hypothetical protein
MLSTIVACFIAGICSPVNLRTHAFCVRLRFRNNISREELFTARVLKSNNRTIIVQLFRFLKVAWQLSIVSKSGLVFGLTDDMLLHILLYFKCF